MKKYIYKNKNLRCRIKYDKTHRHFVIQPQLRYLFIWVNHYEWISVCVKDCFKDMGDYINLNYASGNEGRYYKKDKMDLKKISIELMDDIIYDVEKIKRNIKILKEL